MGTLKGFKQSRWPIAGPTSVYLDSVISHSALDATSNSRHSDQPTEQKRIQNISAAVAGFLATIQREIGLQSPLPSEPSAWTGTFMQCRDGGFGAEDCGLPWFAVSEPG